MKMKMIIYLLVIILLIFTCKSISYAQQIPYPRFSIDFTDAKSPKEVATVLNILLLLTILTLAPAILIMLTSFTRIIIVLSFLRHALGTQQMPPNQILIGLALFLTFFIMSPVFSEINTQALEPYMNKKMNHEEAFQKALRPLREFMFKQTREKDLALMVHLSNMQKPKDRDSVPTQILIPAFAISELKTAFQIGFLIFIPFLIIDMVVASVLMSMGMLMLPPVMISLPFKILLFVLSDGWHLLIRSLVMGFR